MDQYAASAPGLCDCLRPPLRDVMKFLLNLPRLHEGDCSVCFAETYLIE